MKPVSWKCSCCLIWFLLDPTLKTVRMPWITYLCRCYCCSLSRQHMLLVVVVIHTIFLPSFTSVFLWAIQCAKLAESDCRSTCIAVCSGGSLVQGELSCCPYCSFPLLSLTSKPVALELQSILFFWLTHSVKDSDSFVLSANPVQGKQKMHASRATQHLF